MVSKGWRNITLADKKQEQKKQQLKLPWCTYQYKLLLFSLQSIEVQTSLWCQASFQHTFALVFLALKVGSEPPLGGTYKPCKESVRKKSHKWKEMMTIVTPPHVNFVQGCMGQMLIYAMKGTCIYWPNILKAHLCISGSYEIPEVMYIQFYYPVGINTLHDQVKTTL